MYNPRRKVVPAAKANLHSENRMVDANIHVRTTENSWVAESTTFAFIVVASMPARNDWFLHS